MILLTTSKYAGKSNLKHLEYADLEMIHSTSISNTIDVYPYHYSAGSQAEVQLSSLTITVVVISLVLVVVLAVAIISIVCIRRRRNAELAEMRRLPQER